MDRALDTRERRDDGAAPVKTAEENRGSRAAREGSGEVTGSGAAAGGDGGPEDYDTDPMAGGGSLAMPTADGAPDKGGDASQHGSR